LHSSSISFCIQDSYLQDMLDVVQAVNLIWARALNHSYVQRAVRRGRATLRGKLPGELPGELKHHWNKLKICWTAEMLNRYLKNISLKGQKIISLPEAPTVLSSDLQRGWLSTYHTCSTHKYAAYQEEKFWLGILNFETWDVSAWERVSSASACHRSKFQDFFGMPCMCVWNSELIKSFHCMVHMWLFWRQKVQSFQQKLALGGWRVKTKNFANVPLW
jgi:hypothetical protein